MRCDAAVIRLLAVIMRPGFEKLKQNVDWLSKSQSQVHLAHPLSLKPISKEELLGGTGQ